MARWSGKASLKIGMFVALAFGAVAHADDPFKVYLDKGNAFIKADPSAPLSVGTELLMFTDAAGTKAAGSALVMEVNGPLVRLSLDDDAAKAKARFARLKGVAVAAPPAAHLPPGPAFASAAPPPPPPSAPAPTEKRLSPLMGKLEDGLRVRVTNDSDVDWVDCQLRYDDGRYFDLGMLPKHSNDGVMSVKFLRPAGPPEPLFDRVTVTCDEGETVFMFDNPHSPGALKGYVENPGGGRIIVHNTSDKDWNRCDVKKPDKSHYVTKVLKANDSESMRSGNFVKEETIAPASKLSLRCRQGELVIPVNR